MSNAKKQSKKPSSKKTSTKKTATKKPSSKKSAKKTSKQRASEAKNEAAVIDLNKKRSIGSELMQGDAVTFTSERKNAVAEAVEAKIAVDTEISELKKLVQSLLRAQKTEPKTEAAPEKTRSNSRKKSAVKKTASRKKTSSSSRSRRVDENVNRSINPMRLVGYRQKTNVVDADYEFYAHNMYSELKKLVRRGEIDSISELELENEEHWINWHIELGQYDFYINLSPSRTDRFWIKLEFNGELIRRRGHFISPHNVGAAREALDLVRFMRKMIQLYA